MFWKLKRWLLERSIRKYGIKTRVLVTSNGEVLDGNNRVEIALKYGLDVPVYVVEGRCDHVSAKTLNISCPSRYHV